MTVKQITEGITYLFIALGVALITSFGVGCIVWLTWNLLVAGMATYPIMHVTYLQSVGVAIIFDVLMTPSAIYGMKLMYGATRAKELVPEKLSDVKGVAPPESK